MTFLSRLFGSGPPESDFEALALDAASQQITAETVQTPYYRIFQSPEFAAQSLRGGLVV